MHISNSRSSGFSLNFLSGSHISPTLVFGLIIIMALMAFEIFNYTTTDYALKDLLGDLTFAGVPWATILALAFCGIDFAGVARLFTPEQGGEEPKTVWYLFGAWLLAGFMNACLTWWGVSMAIVSHTVQSTAVVAPDVLTKVVPVFVAIMVWVIRILVIGSLTSAGERLLWGVERTQPAPAPRRSTAPAASLNAPTVQPSFAPSAAAPRPSMARSASPISKEETSVFPRPEPTYHSLSASPRQAPRSSTLDEVSSHQTSGSRRL